MKVTRKQYERARAVVKDAEEQRKLVKIWEEATKSFGPRDSHEIVAIEQREDGAIDIKCRLISKNGDVSPPGKDAVVAKV